MKLKIFRKKKIFVLLLMLVVSVYLFIYNKKQPEFAETNNLEFEPKYNVVWKHLIFPLGEENDGLYGEPNEIKSIFEVEDGYILLVNEGIFDYDDKYDHARDSEILIIKIDKNGKRKWEKYIKEKGYYCAVNSAVSVKDGFMGVGSCFSKRKRTFSFYMFKIDKNGKKVWKKIFSYGRKNTLETISKIRNSYIITGVYHTKHKGSYKTYIPILTINENGKILKKKVIKHSKTIDGITHIKTFVKNKDEGYIILGNGEDKKVVLKLDSNFNIFWDRSYNPFECSSFETLINTDNGYVISGYVCGNAEREAKEYSKDFIGDGEKPEDYITNNIPFIIKLNEEGVITKLQTFKDVYGIVKLIKKEHYNDDMFLLIGEFYFKHKSQYDYTDFSYTYMPFFKADSDGDVFDKYYVSCLEGYDGEVNYVIEKEDGYIISNIIWAKAPMTGFPEIFYPHSVVCRINYSMDI